MIACVKKLKGVQNTWICSGTAEIVYTSKDRRTTNIDLKRLPSEGLDLFLFKNDNYTKLSMEINWMWLLGYLMYKYHGMFETFSFKHIICWFVAFQFKWMGRKISNTSSSSQRPGILVSTFDWYLLDTLILHFKSYIESYEKITLRYLP